MSIKDEIIIDKSFALDLDRDDIYPAGATDEARQAQKDLLSSLISGDGILRLVKLAQDAGDLLINAGVIRMAIYPMRWSVVRWDVGDVRFRLECAAFGRMDFTPAFLVDEQAPISQVIFSNMLKNASKRNLVAGNDL